MYTINLQDGAFIAGFNARHQIVVRTTSRSFAKKFKTEYAARAFVAKYAGAGYGFETTQIDSITTQPEAPLTISSL